MMDYKNYKDYKDSKGYKSLAVFIQSQIIHDFTMELCGRYIDKKSRTKDQMEQAARSGKQNIPEGYAQRELSGKLKLTKVARGSLEELLVDFTDFLRQKGMKLWGKDSPEAREVRNLVYRVKEITEGKDYDDYKFYEVYNLYKVYLGDPETAANAMVCLINQTNLMLNRKIEWLEENAAKEDVSSPRENWLMRQLGERSGKAGGDGPLDRR